MAGEFRVRTASGTISIRRLVNCAGLWSDRIARERGLDPGLRTVPYPGGYFRAGASTLATDVR